MKISVYTCCNDAIENEFTLFEGMLQALKFCDEFIYIDGGSSDGTLQWMKEFAKKDARIKIYENPWEKRMHKAMTMIQKNIALSHCSGDWCFLMDADEMYDDFVVSDIRLIIGKCEEFRRNDVGINAVYLRAYHFYGNYYTRCIADPIYKYPYYLGKVYGIRNNLGIHHGNADGDPDGFVDNDDKALDDRNIFSANVGVNHYGHVRSADVYLKKKNAIERRFRPDWQDLKEWDFNKLIRENPECFIKEEFIHPKIMGDRIASTVEVDSDGNENVIHSLVQEYYKKMLPVWLDNIAILRENGVW